MTTSKTEGQSAPVAPESSVDLHALERLRLPPSMILLDVNGTLMRDSQSTKMIFPPDALAALEGELSRLTQAGYITGLCSDSSLHSLRALAQEIGLAAGPIIAENGNVVFDGNAVEVVQPLHDIASIRQDIERMLANEGCLMQGPFQSMEFGGPSSFQGKVWGYDMDRMASIGIFGDPDVITLLGNHYSDSPKVSVDASPEYFYFGMHPGENYKDNKARTLRAVQSLGHTVTLIGNSRSDYVNPSSGVRCMFVNDPAIDRYPEIRRDAAYISSLPQFGDEPIYGVIDCLRSIT